MSLYKENAFSFFPFFFFSALLPDYTLLSFFFTSCHCIYLLYSLIQANDVGILVVVLSILYFTKTYEFPLVPICGGQYWWELIYLRYTKMKCPNEWKINLTSFLYFDGILRNAMKNYLKLLLDYHCNEVAWLRAIISKINLKFWDHFTILTHSISSFKKCLLISFFGHCFIIIMDEGDFGVGISKYWYLYVSFLSIVWASWIHHKIRKIQNL